MASITKPSAAQRLARTIASDILLYNTEKVTEGLKNDDIFERLEQEIAEGHKLFEQRVDAELRDKHNFIDRALVDVLINRAASTVETTLW